MDKPAREGVDATDFCSQSGCKVKLERIIEQFKNGQLRALTNANVLTTGFDAPHEEFIVWYFGEGDCIKLDELLTWLDT